MTQQPGANTRCLSLDELMAMQTQITFAENSPEKLKALRNMLSGDLCTVTLPYMLWKSKCYLMPDPITMLTYAEDDIDWIEVDCNMWYMMEIVGLVGMKSCMVEVDEVDVSANP